MLHSKALPGSASDVPIAENPADARPEGSRFGRHTQLQREDDLPRETETRGAEMPNAVADKVTDLLDFRRRGAVRLQTAIDAHLVVSENSISRCIIRDLSTAGAQLEVEEGITPEREMILAVPQVNIAIVCELAWRRGKRMGVQFCRGRIPADKIAEMMKL
ncbi:PilZ domain-containing protein [Afifella aestuarii]|uniref:PilZ domain-containing protein n=1 Tax=Afifella aestuarii TaxID=1909496 RepID=UPI000FE38E3A|nr:PilZ domain-containing protein [Afifella aestuarii]